MSQTSVLKKLKSKLVINYLLLLESYLNFIKCNLSKTVLTINKRKLIRPVQDV